mgnify:CR=1 FL=1
MALGNDGGISGEKPGVTWHVGLTRYVGLTVKAVAAAVEILGNYFTDDAKANRYYTDDAKSNKYYSQDQ